MTTVIIAKDQVSFLKQAADIFLEAMGLAIKERGQFVVALSGGKTPEAFFQLMADDYYRERVEWRHVFLFWADERCVPPQHAESNYGLTKLKLLSKVPIPTQNVFRIPGEITPPRDAAKSYESALKAFFKVDKSPPKFDLILLGMGEDGHTASLFPNTEALKETDHWAVANYVEKFSAHRITLTLPVLNNAELVVFLCAGDSKAAVVREIFRDDISPTRYPAQMVKPSNGRLTWLLDLKAASKLPDAVKNKSLHV